MSRELEVSDRIDLGARLGPVMTACIGVATRGVQVPHTFSTECQTGATTPGADVRAWLPSRSRKLGEERPQLRRDDFRLAVVGGAQVVEPIQRLYRTLGNSRSSASRDVLRNNGLLLPPSNKTSAPIDL